VSYLVSYVYLPLSLLPPLPFLVGIIMKYIMELKLCLRLVSLPIVVIEKTIIILII